MQELTYLGILIGLKGSGARYLNVGQRSMMKNSDDRRLYQQLRRRGMPAKFINQHFPHLKAGAFTSAYLAKRYSLPITVK